MILRSLFLILLCSALALSEQTIKIVSSLPRTGSANTQTTGVVNGIRMALEEVGGKVGDYKIIHEDWDDASPERGNWDPALEAANADKAIKDPSVVMYVGPYNSGAAKISMPKLNQARLLQISPGATWPGLTKPGTGEPNEPRIYRPSGKIHFFRVVPADDLQGAVAAKWATDMGAKKSFIVHDRELYGKGIASIFEKTAKKLGLQVLGVEGIDAKSSNYRSLATKIRQLNPDVVYFGGLTQSNGGQFAKDLRSAGYQGKLMVPDGCFEKAFIEAAGKENVEGNTFATFGGVPPSELTGKGKVFYENYKKKFNAEPEPYAAYGYESTKAFLDALSRAKSADREALIKAVSEIKDFDGVLGTWSFNENGDTTMTTMSGNTVKNGEWKFEKLLGV